MMDGRVRFDPRVQHVLVGRVTVSHQTRFDGRAVRLAVVTGGWSICAVTVMLTLVHLVFPWLLSRAYWGVGL
jgi:hypothetical protein